MTDHPESLIVGRGNRVGRRDPQGRNRHLTLPDAPPAHALVLTDGQGEVRIPLSRDELSATIEAFNVASEQHRRRDPVNHPRPPFDRAGSSAHRKFVALEGGRRWIEQTAERLGARVADAPPARPGEGETA